jgi:hypothetical protein
MTQKIKLLGSGANVGPMQWALHQHPELWGEHSSRTKTAESPHRELTDIWTRYAKDPAQSPHEPHDAVWYPCADVLPVRDLVYPLMAASRGTKLGGVLITKIPAGATCHPHNDRGWHAQHYTKIAIQIQSAPGQRFCFEGESLETKPGDIFEFDNYFTHWVENPTPYDRITLIACIRTERQEQQEI